MKIAIAGSGISGLTAARKLHDLGHSITLFEQADRTGGHTATIDVEEAGRTLAIDTGFIVFNDWTYPNFIALMNSLGVRSRPTRMSFSVSDQRSGLEYAGSSLNTLFAQRSNLLSPRFLGMLRHILRFNADVENDLLAHPDLAGLPLGDYLQQRQYGAAFRDQYLIPMGAAIWSSREDNMLKVPVGFFVRFFRNHGLLSIRNRPQWHVIEGGSRAYIAPLTAGFEDRIQLQSPILQVQRTATGVDVSTPTGTQRFDHLVFACHSDQALRALGGQASPLERKLLSAIPYERNEVVLHTDIRLLPANRRCWSSWNVSLGHSDDTRPRLTYNMNILQGLESQKTYCVSLNQTSRIDPSTIIGVYQYDHPIFTIEGMQTQERWQDINGHGGIWYCGAWWRNGFHEDGVWSALRVAEAIEQCTRIPEQSHHAA
ncbi:MAG: FAD-dependent oxidoreductase [Pseudomonadales bacterium]|nr:FAD-dependent oxidoreductase [Pseudomonadales bacterium]MCP5356763.1 FAD-dependent oxidoreductase [Pseudomonadales bacterium]